MSNQQNMIALEKANRIRLDRARLKRQILSGREKLATLLLDPPECVMSAPISELLRAQRRWGATRSRKLLDGYSIRENKKVEDLTTRQRNLLSGALIEGEMRR